MSNKIIETAEAGMDAIERLISGLPGIKGYRDRELRRDADYRLRQLIAETLDEQKRALSDLQRKLIANGGLEWTDNVDRAVQRVQTLSDRVKTAAYGYAGLFDRVKVGDAQLDALHRFDVAMHERLSQVQTAIADLDAAVAAKEGIGQASERLTHLLGDLNDLYRRRKEAIEDPSNLTGADDAEADQSV